MNFGVIGYGAFGKLLAQSLAPYGGVTVYSKRDISDDLKGGIKQAELSEVAKAKIVIISSGLSELEDVCVSLAPLVSKTTVVADVCSVKSRPVEIMKRTLKGKCQLVATHPLFGPQTVKDNKIKGERIVVYPIDCPQFSNVVMALRDIVGLKVIEMDPETHDKEIAWVHGLTFFVGRGLLDIDPPKSDLATGYYQKLLDLVELESTHSIELFKTVEQGNPYAAEVRQKFIESIEKMNNELKSSK